MAAPAAGSLWPGISYADPSPDTDQESYGYSARMNDSFTRLNTMAQAYAQPGTGLTGDAALKDAVIAGLDHLYSDVYNEDKARFGNWWNFQIGSPQALMDTAVLLYDHLSAEQIAAYCRAVDKFLPDSAVAQYTGTSTGANRVDLCRGIILRGVVGGSAAKIQLGRDALSPVFPYVTTGDGFYADGSFIQHTDVPYIGGYGAVLHDGLGRLFALLRDSTWQVNDPGGQLFLDTVEKAIAPFIYNGLMMDNVSSRGISRGLTVSDPFQLPQDDHTRAHSVMASVLLVGQGASPEEQARWKAMVKGWLQRDYYGPALKNPKLSLVNTARLQTLFDDDTVKASPEPTEHRVFSNMDRATHRRRDWGPRSAWPPSASRTTSSATVSTPVAITPARAGCPGGATTTVSSSTRTPSGRRSTPTGCPASPSRRSRCRTASAATGATRSRTRPGWAAPPTASSASPGSICAASTAR